MGHSEDANKAYIQDLNKLCKEIGGNFYSAKNILTNKNLFVADIDSTEPLDLMKFILNPPREITEEGVDTLKSLVR